MSIQDYKVFLKENFKVLSRHGIRDNLTIQKKNGHKVYSTIDSLVSAMMSDLNLSITEINIPELNKALDELSEVNTATESDYVSEEEIWRQYGEIVEIRGGNQLMIKKAYEGDYFTQGREGDEIDIFDAKQILAKMLSQISRKAKLPYKSKDIEKDITRELKKQLDLRKKTVFEKLRHNPKAPEDGFLHVLEGLQVENITRDLKIIKHWMWCIKRRVLGLKVYNQVFPVIVGAQGICKCLLVKRLCTPLGEFFSELELKDISEERSIANDSNQNLALLFDEMASSERASIQHLKRWVTADELTVRIMGTNDRITKEKIAQGIGTSNDDLRDILNDKTGNRRFYQVLCKRPVNSPANWVNEPEYDEGSDVWQEMWQHVDESLPDGYWSPSKDKDILEVMAASVSRNPIDLWLEDEIDWEYTYQDEQFIFKSTEVLFERYNEWLTSAKYRSGYNKENFSRHLKTFLSARDSRCIKTKQRSENQNLNGFLVPSKEGRKEQKKFKTRAVQE